MAKITINPRFRWSDKLQRFILSGHDGQYQSNEVPLLFDRGVQKTAGQQTKEATAQGDVYGGRGTTEYNAVIPGLIQQAQHPTGYEPLEKSSMLTSAAESLGGVNAGAGGEARLTAMRTRNAAGFAPALAEASRAKGRALAGVGLDINMRDAELRRQQQEAARSQLENLYRTNLGQQTSEQQLAEEALRTKLQAGKSGWYQNLLAGINTFMPLLKAKMGGGGGGGGGFQDTESGPDYA